jgi:hypothetical protein
LGINKATSQAFKKVASDLKTSKDNVNKEIKQFLEIFDDKKKNLGIYTSSVQTLVKKLKMAIEHGH